MDTILMSKSSYRNKLDHLTEQPFTITNCKICNKKYYHMAIDNKEFTCPPCANGKEPDEVNI